VLIGDEPAAPVAAAPEPEKRSWISRLTSGLSRSSKQLSENIAGVFTKRKLDEDTLEELEDILIQADLGIETAMRITDTLASGRYGKEVSGEEVRGVMAEEVAKVLDPVANRWNSTFPSSRMSSWSSASTAPARRRPSASSPPSCATPA
jgi:fused signal recognition particle receptor